MAGIGFYVTLTTFHNSVATFQTAESIIEVKLLARRGVVHEGGFIHFHCGGFMKKIFSLVIAFLTVSTIQSALAQSAEDLFQRGVQLEEVKGELEKAIDVYKSVVDKFAANKPIAAKALLHLGGCYEKLGNTEAKKAYERVVKEFADQSSVVKEARARLIALGNGKKPEEKPAMTTRQVWAGPGVDILGAPSPDGRFITYTDWETGDLAMRDLVTGEKRRLTNKAPGWVSSEFALFSVPSPDGKKVAYTWFNKDFLYDLRVIGIGDSTPRILYSNEEVEYVQPHDWSRDGKWILAGLSRKDRTNQIALISVEDASVRILKSMDWRGVQKMSLSPDGRYIVYDFPPKEDAQERDIYLLATDGSREVRLTEHRANDLFPIWTPDGKSVLFASDRTGTLGLYAIKVAEGKPQGSQELVKSDIGRALPMGITRNGSFYYGVQSELRDIYFAEIDIHQRKLITTPRPLSESQRLISGNFSPDWSPDGKYLAYLLHLGALPGEIGPQHLAIRSVETGEERVFSPKLSYMSRPRWAPNGRSIFVTGKDLKSRQGLYKIDAQTGEISVIVHSEPGTYAQWVECSPDGRTIFYNEGNPKGNRLVKRDIETGQETELLRGTVRDIAVSPDGRQLLLNFSYPKAPQSLWLMSTAGGEPREVLRAKEGENIVGFRGFAWTQDGKSALYIKKTNNDPKDETFELWQISVDGGEPQSLGLKMSSLRQVRLHPDGKRIVFVAGQPKGEVWVMENFLPSNGRAQK